MTLYTIERDSKHPYPPRITSFTKPFWEALDANRFITSRCRHCEAMTFPPKIICPKCWSDELQWVEPGIQGKLYSWTRIHAGPEVFQDLLPYAVGIVDLDSGVRLACPIIHDTPLKCDMHVELMRIQYADGSQLAAKPVDAER